MSATAQGEIEIILKMSESAMNAQIMAAQEAAAKGSTKRVAENERQVMAMLDLERKKYIASAADAELGKIEQVIAMRKKAMEYKGLGFSDERAEKMAKAGVLYDAEIADKKRASEHALQQAKQLAESQAGLNAQKLKELEISRQIALQEEKIGMEVVKRNLISNEMTAKQAMLTRLANQVGQATYTGMGQTSRGSLFAGGTNGAYRVGMFSQQIQDVAVSMQMGMSMSRVIAQQGSQIASIFGTGGMVLGGVVAIGAALVDVVMKTEKADRAWQAYGETAKKYGENSAGFLKAAARDLDSAENLRNRRIYGEQEAEMMKMEMDHARRLEEIKNTPGSRIMARKAIEAENERYAEQIALVETLRAQQEKLNADRHNKEWDNKVAQGQALAFALTNPTQEEQMKRLSEKLAQINEERKGIGGMEATEKENEALEIQNRLMEMGQSRQKEIDDNQKRAAELQQKAFEKELSGQQRLNKLSAEYLAIVKKIKIEQDPIKKSQMQLEAARVLMDAAAAKKQANQENKVAEKEKEEARKDAARKNLDNRLAPFEQINKLASDIEAGAYSPQARAAQRAQEHSHAAALRQAARSTARSMFGENWQKLNGMERDYQTKLLMHNAAVAGNRDKIEARFNKDDIDSLAAAIEKLLAK